MEGGDLDVLQQNNPSVGLDMPPEISTVDVTIPWPGDSESDCRLKIVQSDPCPMTIAGLYPNLETNEPW
jgi:hypothetical protein